jgi:cytochrome b involved in lipid metabolism
MSLAELHEYSAEEVALHNTGDDCWIILGEDGRQKVYDVTAFLEEHPGGPEILVDVAGRDVQEEFEEIGHSKAAHEMIEQLCIGRLKLGKKKRKKARVVLPMFQDEKLIRSASDTRLVSIMFVFMSIFFAYLLYPIE